MSWKDKCENLISVNITNDEISHLTHERRAKGWTERWREGWAVGNNLWLSFNGV
jgi:hypothetical protein